MADSKTDQVEMTALHQLVQEIIGGSVRRNTFTQWELELLLDLQLCSIRKGTRSETLRRYLRAVQQEFTRGSVSPLRLSAFLDAENQRSRAGAGAPVKLEAVSVK
ncbi:MAG: hypothetical protein JWP08_797 [Bryobacterales bacterium]|jgi:hypothetical protein|nr:hypothetical protein [Bryobacterales bacterium]